MYVSAAHNFVRLGVVEGWGPSENALVKKRYPDLMKEDILTNVPRLPISTVATDRNRSEHILLLHSIYILFKSDLKEIHTQVIGQKIQSISIEDHKMLTTVMTECTLGPLSPATD